MQLSSFGQEKAKAFMQEQARPLEHALYTYHFEGGSAQAVLAQLAPFRYPDGGFGLGLEPDLRLSASSAVATTVALHHLHTVQASADNPLVQGAVGYLLDIYDPVLQAWPIIPANDNRAPHAPWWTYDQDLAGRWRNFQSNPRAEIVGYLYAYPSLTPSGLIAQLTDALLAHLENPPQPLEMHDLLCYVSLAEARGVPETVRERAVHLLNPLIDKAVSRDPAEWHRYALKPLDVATAPDSPFASLLAEALETNLDFVIQQQGEDGAWEPNWSWGGSFPEAWDQAKREWKGVLTLRNLRRLGNFGRLSR